ncbi:MAG: hypothetical protein O3A80_00905 [bacterium]|nr:hypothetical protein [bacterium]
MSLSRILRYSFYLVVALTLCKGLYHLASQAWYFFEGAYAGDAKYYWTVGKGMLNGHVLYTDIFDTKPPGIYLLSALSLWMFDDGTLGFWINALMVVAYPVLFGCAAHIIVRDLSRNRRLYIILSSLLFGSLISLYAGFQGEAWQVEWYGAFFGSLYALALVCLPWRNSRSALAILSICMILSIGFKEPFALSLIGVGLLLLPKKKDLLSGLAVPLGITTAVGVVGLLLFGYAHGYFTTYLPSHFGHNLIRSTPLWQRGLYIDILFRFLWEFSYLFSALIAALLTHALLRSRQYPRPIVRVLLVLFAFYLALTAGNLRGYPVSNHFVVLVPLYTALFLLLLQHVIANGYHRIFHTCMGLMMFTLLTLPMKDGIPHYSVVLSANKEGVVEHRETAQQLDEILDACDVERYFFVEEKPFMEYMNHSPLNFFVYTGSEAIVYYHPVLIEKQLQSFSNAKIVIARGESYEISQDPAKKNLSEMTFRYLANNFTIIPWSCAEGLPIPVGYSVLFRKDPDNMKPFLFKMK